MIRVLITGADSYIGVSFDEYAKKHYGTEISVDTVDMRDNSWRDKDFSCYDAVYHVAGIAHVDVSNLTEEKKKQYYAVNTDLAIEAAKKAKKEGVKQFIFMSSALVYGDSAPYGKDKVIDRNTIPEPTSIYGDSKFKAEAGLNELSDADFNVAILRPPMIYGKNSKGNYPSLAKMARKLIIFPNVKNQRSMLYIENLCEFLCQIMLRCESGIFWPQNAEYVNTCNMVKTIAEVKNHKICVGRAFNWLVALASIIPGKTRTLANKAFGNLCYDKSLSKFDFEYQIVDFKESIRRTEG